MEHSIPFQELVTSVDAEDFAKKNRTLDLPLEINNVTSKLEFQIISFGVSYPNPEIMVTQTIDPIIKSKPQFRNCCFYCHKPNHSVAICLRKQAEEKEREQNPCSRSKTAVK